MFRIEKIFLQKGALLKGHFLLSSGRHSDRYIQCAKVLQYPEIAEKIAFQLYRRLVNKNKQLRVDVVISPALGGIIIGQELARQFKCRAIFCEREDGKMKLRRGFAIKKGESCLVVEDVITTGGSTKEVIDVVKSSGGQLAGVAAIVDRSDRKDFAISLLRVRFKTYAPQNCPLCKKKIPIIKPGSR